QLWAKKRRPRHVPARSCKTGHQLVGNRIGHGYCDDRDCPGHLLSRACRRRTKCDNDVGLTPNQFSSQLADLIGTPICIFALYGEVLSLSVYPSSCNPCRKALSMLKVGSGSSERPGDRMPIRRVQSGGCARATSGHATLTPPTSVMNSRRLTRPSGLR